MFQVLNGVLQNDEFGWSIFEDFSTAALAEIKQVFASSEILVSPSIEARICVLCVCDVAPKNAPSLTSFHRLATSVDSPASSRYIVSGCDNFCQVLLMFE